jgi:penicillin-binding protein 2
MMRQNKSAAQNLRSRLNRRSLILFGGQMAVVGLLGWRMRQLGVKQAEEFRLLAEENRVNMRLIPPSRGLIFDRRGEPVASNASVYKIEMVREQAGDPEAVLERLSAIVPLSREEIDDALKEMSKRRGFVPVTVASGLEWEHIAAVSANAPVLPGVLPAEGQFRKYPKGADFAHIVGYVGPVSDFDLERTDDDDPLLLIPKFQIGKNGIEVREDHTLRGSAGLKRIEVNSVGRVIRELGREESTQGTNLQLTVDARLQALALRRLGTDSAAAVVMDVRNGDLMALASAPSFDPNKFVNGISVGDWRSLNENKYRPLANKTVSGTYPPGSTFKIVVALAALEAGVIGPEEKVFCPGYMQLGNRRFHCWRRGGHGHVHVRQGLQQSCDVFFYEAARRVGVDKITEMANRMGLGIQHDLPLPAVREGLTPTRAWKLARRGEGWQQGDTLNTGIGQGFVLASPLQLAVMTARLASGQAVAPRLIHPQGYAAGETPAPPDLLGIDPAHLALVRGGMYDVSNSPRGTAYRSRLQREDAEIAGKTGTSQVRFITKEERARGVIRNEDLPWERRDHALFVGFAPFDAPRYAISVIVEHGGGGSAAAAPIAKDIMNAALDLGEAGYGPMPANDREQRANQTPAGKRRI